MYHWAALLGLAVAGGTSGELTDADFDNAKTGATLNADAGFRAGCRLAEAWVAAEQDALECFGDTGSAPVEAAKAYAQTAACKSVQSISKSDRADIETKYRAFATASETTRLADANEFERILASDARRAACIRFRARRLSAFTDKQAAKADEDNQASRNKIHFDDILRKAQSLASSATKGNGQVESPGTPDRLLASLMTGLGAESKQDGTQLALTLNITSLIYKEPDRLKLPAFARNLFLRTIVPLDKTDSDPDEPAPASDASGDSGVRRTTLIVGSSFLDDTDPRLVTYDDCFDTAFAVQPHSMVFSEDESKKILDDRAPLLDICARRAANAHRLAVRAAIGFVSTEDPVRTKLEFASGTVVYGPHSSIVLNGVYQRVLLPSKLHIFGGGLSFGRNLGGKLGGSDAWIRLAIDTVILARHIDAGGATSLDFRVTASIKAKVLGDAYLTLNIGPRIRTDDDETSLLATTGITYDADQLLIPESALAR